MGTLEVGEAGGLAGFGSWEGRGTQEAHVLSHRCVQSPAAHRSPCAVYLHPTAVVWLPAEGLWHPEGTGSSQRGSSRADSGKMLRPVLCSAGHGR